MERNIKKTAAAFFAAAAVFAMGSVVVFRIDCKYGNLGSLIKP